MVGVVRKLGELGCVCRLGKLTTVQRFFLFNRWIVSGGNATLQQLRRRALVQADNTIVYVSGHLTKKSLESVAYAETKRPFRDCVNSSCFKTGQKVDFDWLIGLGAYNCLRSRSAEKG
ncbi:hypothetical protein TNCV_5104851 [Trichonephila clavipes]|nr:hypothetical protein TNCV_5104851 [Trichonephila clavipes]